MKFITDDIILYKYVYIYCICMYVYYCVKFSLYPVLTHICFLSCRHLCRKVDKFLVEHIVSNL